MSSPRCRTRTCLARVTRRPPQPTRHPLKQADTRTVLCAHPLFEDNRTEALGEILHGIRLRVRAHEASRRRAVYASAALQFFPMACPRVAICLVQALKPNPMPELVHDHCGRREAIEPRSTMHGELLDVDEEPIVVPEPCGIVGAVRDEDDLHALCAALPSTRSKPRARDGPRSCCDLDLASESSCVAVRHPHTDTLCPKETRPFVHETRAYHDRFIG